MRVSTEQRSVAVDPGGSVQVTVHVVNTGTIIDGVSARLIGLDGADVRVEPAMLPLFPDAGADIVLTLAVPETHQAGVHPLVVEVLSHTTAEVAHADLDLAVAPRPAVALRSTPRMIRARRSGRFVLEVDNQGNIPLEVSLAPPPSEPGVVLRLSPATLRVEPGTTTPVMAVLKGPRMITGGEIDRTLGVELTGRRVDSAGPDEAEAPADLTTSTVLQLRQRPVLSRGLITSFILLAIVGLWAAVFVFGLNQAFRDDPLTKAAPASYFAALNQSGTDPAPVAATTGDGFFLEKTGLVSPDVGGSIAGTVIAGSDGRPVGRVLVEAFREGQRDEPVGTAASQTDGTYLLTGLFPTSYELKFSGDGFEPTWLKGAGGQGRVLVQAVPRETVEAAAEPIALQGLPGSLRGRVDAGEDTAAAPTEVSIRLLSNVGVPGAPVTRTTVDGAYRFDGLVTPGTYQVTFTTPGYAATSIVEELEGGEDLLRPEVLLGADAGTLTGRVVDQSGAGIGDATVTTSVGGSERTVTTPTAGLVGAFTLDQLPTPGTFVRHHLRARLRHQDRDRRPRTGRQCGAHLHAVLGDHQRQRLGHRHRGQRDRWGPGDPGRRHGRRGGQPLDHDLDRGHRGRVVLLQRPRSRRLHAHLRAPRLRRADPAGLARRQHPGVREVVPARQASRLDPGPGGRPGQQRSGRRGHDHRHQRRDQRVGRQRRCSRGDAAPPGRVPHHRADPRLVQRHGVGRRLRPAHGPGPGRGRLERPAPGHPARGGGLRCASSSPRTGSR